MMRLIDADALKKKYTMVIKRTSPSAIMERPAILLEDVDEAPTIDAELVRYSKWDAVDEDDFHYRCFSCGFNAYGNTMEVVDGTFRYCPHCGARMEGVDDGT